VSGTAVASPSQDRDLVALALRGDHQAYGELVCRCREPVVGIVYRMCGDPDLAEEVAQEAFLRAWQRLTTYRPEYAFRNWVIGIALHLALDRLRREPELAGEEALERVPVNESPEGALEKEERAAAVRQAVLALPPASRAVLVLREYQELSYAEIAAVLGIPIGTVMSRLNYARSQLRTTLAGLLEAA
jgi:RNA polymerase sigma-70 factor (ECF subfamily)